MIVGIVASQITAVPTLQWVFLSENSSSGFPVLAQIIVSDWPNRVAEVRAYLDINYPATNYYNGYTVAIQIEVDIYLDFRVMLI